MEDEPIADDNERWIPNWLHEKQLPVFSSPATFPKLSTLAYVVVGPRPAGPAGRKFDRGKISRSPLGIQALLKLVYGGTLQSDNSKDVTKPMLNAGDILEDVPPPVVIILDVPRPTFIPSVVNAFNNEYQPFRSRDPYHREKYAVKVVYHLLGPGVIEDFRYTNFMKGFAGTTRVLFRIFLTPLLSKQMAFST